MIAPPATRISRAPLWVVTRSQRSASFSADGCAGAAAATTSAATVVYFLSGRKPRQAVPSKRLRLWARDLAGIPEWLFDESYHHVGDVAETIALLLPPAENASGRPLADWVGNHLLPLRTLAEEKQKADVLAAWAALDARQRFVWNKLITGEFRVGVSQLLVVRALAQVSGLPADVVSHRLMGAWEPTPHFYAGLVAPTAATPTPAGRTRSSWRTRSKASRTLWESPPTGRPSGSGTASGRRWSDGPGGRSCGRAARSW